MIDAIAPQNCDTVFNSGVGLCDFTGAYAQSLSVALSAPVTSLAGQGPSAPTRAVASPFPTWFSDITPQEPTPGQIIVAAMSVDALDNTAALNAALFACQNVQGCTVTPPMTGTYRFLLDSGKVVINGPRTDFTLDGLGSTFLFSKTANPTASDGALIQINGPCLRCKLRNYIVDWDWQKWRLGSVVQFQSASNLQWTFEMTEFARGATVDLDTIRGWYVFTPLTDVSATSSVKWAFGSRSSREIFFLNNEVSSVQGIGRRAVTSTIKTAASSLKSTRTTTKKTTSTSEPTNSLYKLMRIPPEAIVVQGKVNASKVPAGEDGEDIGTETLGSNIIQLTFASPISLVPETTPQPGTFWLARHFTYENPGHYVSQCQHCIFEDIVVQSAPGKAFVVLDGSEFITFRRVKVVPPASPREGIARALSVAADGLFVSKSMGKIRIEDVEVSQSSDDCVNINNPIAGHLSVGVDRSILQVANSPAWHIDFKTGDIIRFISDEFAGIVVGYGPGAWTGDGTTANVQQVVFDASTSTWTLQLDRLLPLAWSTRVLSRLLVYNTRYDNSKVIIKNLYCHHNRARGVLLQVNDVLVTDSIFEANQRAGLAFRSSVYWEESAGVHRAVAANNKFIRTDQDGDKANTEAVVVMDDDVFDQSIQPIYDHVHGQILFTGNVIQETTRRPWIVKVTDDALLTNNVVINREAQIVNDPERGVAKHYRCTNVGVLANVWSCSPLANLLTPVLFEGSGQVGGNLVYIE
jgi:hypothetical protein